MEVRVQGLGFLGSGFRVTVRIYGLGIYKG